MKLYEDSSQYEETFYGSGVFENMLDGNLVQGNIRKTLNPDNIQRNVENMILDQVETKLHRPVRGKDKFTGKSLASSLAKNVGNAIDDQGMVRPNAHELMKDLTISKRIPKEMLKEKKAKVKETPQLSTLLGKTSSRRAKKGKGLRVHGTGMSLHGTGISYI